MAVQLVRHCLLTEVVVRVRIVNSNLALNPRPYVRTFEISLDALAQISADLSSREQKIEAEVRQAGAAHQNNISVTEAQCHVCML